MAMDDKVKIRCPACARMFREKASRLRNGFQINCSNCKKLITLSKKTEISFIRRALETDKEIRAAKQAELVARVYAGVASAARARRHSASGRPSTSPGF